jgi:ABC-2 type transport system permease protein
MGLEDFEIVERRSGYSSLAAMGALYGLTFRQHLHGRRWLVIALLFSLPIGLAVLIRATAAQIDPIVLEFTLAFMLIPQALVPIVALTYASGIIRDEQEDQTLTYLLIRPIPRWAIYSIKLLATLTTTILLTTLFTALTFLAIYVGNQTSFSDACGRALKTIAMHDLAVLAYCCLFGLMSLVTNRSLVLGIVYIILIEGLIANMPFGLRLITVIYYCRSIAYQTLSFNVTNPRATVNVAASAWQFDPISTANLITIPNCIIILVVASLVCAVIGSMMCAQREFHVKTPEGN